MLDIIFKLFNCSLLLRRRRGLFLSRVAKYPVTPDSCYRKRPTRLVLWNMTKVLNIIFLARGLFKIEWTVNYEGEGKRNNRELLQRANFHTTNRNRNMKTFFSWKISQGKNIFVWRNPLNLSDLLLLCKRFFDLRHNLYELKFWPRGQYLTIREFWMQNFGEREMEKWKNWSKAQSREWEHSFSCFRSLWKQGCFADMFSFGWVVSKNEHLEI